MFSRSLLVRCALLCGALYACGCNSDDAAADHLAQSAAKPGDKPTIGEPGRPRDGKVPFRIIRSFPHDRGAYTQGLMYVDGILYEGTGHYGQSMLRRVDLETGEWKKHKFKTLEYQYFGEGICVFGDAIYQLTWQENVAFVYDKATFELRKTFPLDTDGWGLTTDGKQLISSDGSSTLSFRDPKTFKATRRLTVKQERTMGSGKKQKVAIRNINELEYIHGEIYANIYETSLIAVIDPTTGLVRSTIDLNTLYDEMPNTKKRWHGERRLDYVANGIAFDAKTGHLLVTGKWWPKLFEIELY